MRLLTALLLSDKDQAEMFLVDPNGRKYKYRLLASHYERKPGEEGDTFTLRIYHVTYPYMQPGKGWGDKVIAGDSYKTCQFQGLEAFLAYLEKYDFSAEQGWLPVEDEPKEGK